MNLVFKKIVFIISTILTLTYLIYRTFYTIPFSTNLFFIIVSIFILLIEIWDGIDFIIYYYKLTLKRVVYKPKKLNKKDYPEIDIFIATINEDISLVEETVKCCVSMNYPDKKKLHFYLCDDGRRKEMKEISKKYKINYITRDNNKDAKAGNYNHALSVTKSPYIVTFDADMRPKKEFLTTVVPYMIGIDNVGFVQVPQSFDNPDIYQLRFKVYDNIPSEQDYFYKVIQPSRMLTNTVVYCGTNAIISREALDKVGGFANLTVTEDIATGMFIESYGYKGIALDVDLVYGKSVNDIDSFFKQRSRWGCGSLQILHNYGILKNKQMSFRQKYEYLSGILYWMFCYKRFIYLLIPLLYALFGIEIIDANININLFLSLLFLNYIVKRIIIDLTEGHKRSYTWYAIYEIVLAPVMSFVITRELLGFGSLKFDVSSKNSGANNMSTLNKKVLCSHLMILFFNLLGIGLSLFKSYYLGLNAYLLTMTWLSINVIYLLLVISFDLNTNPYYPKGYNPHKTDKFTYKSFGLLIKMIFKRSMKNENN